MGPFSLLPSTQTALEHSSYEYTTYMGLKTDTSQTPLLLLCHVGFRGLSWACVACRGFSWACIGFRGWSWALIGTPVGRVNSRIIIKRKRKTYLGLETRHVLSPPCCCFATSAFVSYRGPVLAVVGFRGPVLAFVGLHRLWWPVVSLRGTPVGLRLCELSWACIRHHGPVLAFVVPAFRVVVMPW